MTDLATNTDSNGAEEDISAMVADVFGISSDPAPEPTPAADPAQQPSVGTEGAAAGQQEPSPAAAAPAAATPTPAADPAGTGSAPAAPASTTEQQPQATPAPQPQVVDERDLRIASLEAQLAAAKPQAPAEAPQPAAGQQDGTQPAAAAPEIKPIDVQLPPQLLGAIFGEDPNAAAQGLNALVSGIATSLTHSFNQQLTALKTEFETRLAGVGQQSQEEKQAQAAASQREDYFKVFPDHNKPVLLPILAQLSREMAAEMPGVEWDDKFRDALGARMNAKLQELGVNAQPAAAAAPVPAAPAAFLPQGARPAPEGADDNIIMDTLAGF